VLGFNYWGELTTPGELELAELELGATDEIDRIVVIAYGWSYDKEASYGNYQRMVSDLTGGGGITPRTR